MIVPYGLPMGLLKCNKWRLAKNFGSLEWFVCGFQFDPSLHAAMVWPKKRGFWGSVQTTDGTGCAFPQKIACGFEKNCMYKCLLILPSFLYFDQGRRSCPRASCIVYRRPLNRHLTVLWHSRHRTAASFLSYFILVVGSHIFLLRMHQLHGRVSHSTS